MGDNKDIISKKTQRKIDLLQRRDMAVKLRLDGYTYQEIADAMYELASRGQVVLPESYDKRFAHNDVTTVMKEVKESLVESGEMLRVMELENCNRLQNAIMDKALRGDLKAIDRVLSIMNQRAKYVPDLVQPQKVKVSTWQNEIIDLIRQGKITMEDVRDVSPKIAERVMAQLTDGGSTGGFGNSDAVVEGEYADVAETDEEVS